MSKNRSETSRQQWIAVVVAGALLAATPLLAGESRWYLAGKLGQASVQADLGPSGLGWRVDGEDAAASVEGGYLVHKYLAVQAGYHDLGAYTGQPLPCPFCGPCPEGQVCPLILVDPSFPVFPVEAELTGFSLSAIPRWPVTERISVYGKLGVLDWDGRLSPPPGVVVQAADRGPSDRDLLAGLGAQYAFPKGLGVLLEYETTDLFDTVNLGASWRF